MTVSKTRELKARARVLIMDKHGFLALVTFIVTMVYLLMTYVLNGAFPAAGGMLNLILGLVCSLLINIVYYLFCAGQSALYLRLCRGQELKLGQLTEAFARRPEPVAVYAAVQFAIQTVAANLALWLMGGLWRSTGAAELLGLGAGAAALLVLLVWIELGLSMAFFVYCDNPQQSGLQLLRESLQLMHGNKARFFCLMVSFAGIMLLVLLSSGIGLLFAQPYMITVQALFYLDLKKTQADI